MSRLVPGQEDPIWDCRGCGRSFRGVPGLLLVTSDVKRLPFCVECGKVVHYGELRTSERVETGREGLEEAQTGQDAG